MASRTILANALLLGFPFLAVSQAPLSRKVRIPHDTMLAFEIVQQLDSGTAKVGDDVPLRLARPLVVGGPINPITVLPVGTEVHGRIAQVKHAGRNKTAARCGDGRLAIEVEQIIFPDRSAARVRTVWPYRSDGGFLPVTADLLQADWWTMTHPITSLSSNLGPIPLMAVAVTPICAALEAIKRSLVRPMLNLATISERKRPCQMLVRESVVLPGSIVTVAIIQDHTLRI